MRQGAREDIAANVYVCMCVCVCACVYLTSPDDHLFLNTFSHIIFNYMDKTYARTHVPEYIWTKQHRGCP